jgi:two-component system alkaline phosphatase synthesis response regulator PhoP
MGPKGEAEILLADDERAFRSGMKALLESEGFAVRTARDGEEAVRMFAERRPDAVVLDVMMPKMNGFRACEEIRREDRRVPVVFLTAKDAEADQVRALGLGADDYVSKSAPESLFLARIRRALERSRELSAGAAGAADADGRIRLGRTTVDMATLEVSVAGKPSGRLTKTEADILRVLHNGRGRSFSTEQLIAALRGKGFACEDTMVYVHVSNLRRKLGPAASLLGNSWKSGYSLST